MGIMSRLARAWNVFAHDHPERYARSNYSEYRPSYRSFGSTNLVQTLYNKIALDVANTPIRHVKVDQNGRYDSEKDSSLNECLSLMANIDQTSNALIYELVYTMLETGSAVLVPVDTDTALNEEGSFDVLSLRVGRIESWYTDSVDVNLYNDRSGKRETIRISKNSAAIVYSPLYDVTASNNSLANRLARKLDALDAIDNSALGKKLDLIIQLPYSVRGELRQQQAETRREAIEQQLRNSEIGVAYVDGAEKITQLNRPVENNLLDQVKYLSEQLYNALGFTESVFNGTADAETNLSYYNRTVKPILDTITKSATMVFLTKTARSQGQRIIYVRDPFAATSLDSISSMAQTFITNRVMTPNEIRSIIGLPQSTDPKADQLDNPYTSSANADARSSSNQEVQNGST